VVGNAGILNLRDCLKTEGLLPCFDKLSISSDTNSRGHKGKKALCRWCLYDFAPQSCRVVVSSQTISQEYPGYFPPTNILSSTWKCCILAPCCSR
jgi:hypothetical protein